MRVNSESSTGRPPLICVVGRSGSGKTTLIEKLIPLIRERGCRIGTIKHHAHPDFDFDVPGKDSWRYANAGSKHVIIAAPGKVGSVELTEGDLALDELALRMDGVDLILAEGYHWEAKPKIEVLRSTRSHELRCDPGQLSAVITDLPLDLPVPVFGLDDTEALADWLVSTFLSPARRAAEDAE
jgi:molybdopterin-guanine dinucleotide biosynthesis protein B